MKKKIVVFTDLPFSGSGYHSQMIPVMSELSKNYDVKAIGLGYKREEHWFDFSISPARSVSEGVAMSSNLIKLWKPDVFLCALDIPLQIEIAKEIKKHEIPYIAITPLENPPLTTTWAVGLFPIDFILFISKFGAAEAMSKGLRRVGTVEFGVNSDVFFPPSQEERKNIRDFFGVMEDDYVVLTVADNQERKNLWAAFEIVSRVSKRLSEIGKKLHYYLVTREHSPVGYKLRDMAFDLGIDKILHIIERGISPEDLRKFYAMSDAFLLTSKAEGLGMPVLESMACKLPVIATNTGGLSEILSDGRGFLIDSEYEFIDVWGNSKRSMIHISHASDVLFNVLTGETDSTAAIEKSYQFVTSRTLENCMKAIYYALGEVFNGSENK